MGDKNAHKDPAPPAHPQPPPPMLCRRLPGIVSLPASTSEKALPSHLAAAAAWLVLVLLPVYLNDSSKTSHAEPVVPWVTHRPPNQMNTAPHPIAPQTACTLFPVHAPLHPC